MKGNVERPDNHEDKTAHHTTKFQRNLVFGLATREEIQLGSLLSTSLLFKVLPAKEWDISKLFLSLSDTY